MSYFDDLEDMVFYRPRRYYTPKEALSKAERKLVKPLLKKIDTEISNAREKGNKELTINVGERVTIILEAVEHDTCEGCFFKGVAGYCGAAPLGLKCLPKYRSDKKNVIFKEVKE